MDPERLPTAQRHMLDIAANRKTRKWSPVELLGRALWEVLRVPLFAWTPRPLWGWRRWVLRMFGAHIGRNVHVYPSVRIAVPWNLRADENSALGDRVIIYNLGQIDIGRDVTVSQHAHLCAGTHDYTRPDMPLLKVPISIGDGAWICADAFIGPGVAVGSMAVVGARCVVVKDVASGKIMVGNPARAVGDRTVRTGDGEFPRA